MLGRLLREPLLHFLLLGGVLFAIFGAARRHNAGVADRQIVVSAADIDRLAARVLADLASPARRGRAGGANPRITSARRCCIAPRSRSVWTRTTRSSAAGCARRWSFCSRTRCQPPQEAELRAYLEAHAEKFRTQPLISFRQVFVSPSRGETAEADARQILARLVSAAPGAADEGDTLLLGDAFS